MKPIRSAVTATIAAAVMLIVAACSQFALIEPEKPVTIAGTYVLDPQIAWSRISDGELEMWTVDGPLLNHVRFYNGIVDGEPLLHLRGIAADSLPRFRKSMSPLEVRDLVVATFARDGLLNVATHDLRPTPFGPDDGYRFEYTYQTRDGLKKKGFAVGTIHDGRLFLIVYSAPEIFYFDRYKDVVERMIGSLRAV